MRRNTRKQPRSEYAGKIILSWDTELGSHYATARCVDISDHGLAVNLHQPIPTQTYVTFRLDRLELAGRAAVRHCSKRGAYYRIGLEFGVGLGFTVADKMLVAT